MILELADIRIHPGQNAAFEEAIQRGIHTTAVRAKGFQGYKVNRGIESPERYILQFFLGHVGRPHRGFPARAAVSRAACHVGPFAAAPPAVEHFELVS